MKRRIYATLKQWKESEDRMPLLLTGARQTGKSWILREFGKNEFANCIVIDFEKQSPIVHSIETVLDQYGLDANRILAAVGIDGVEKRVDNTLIVFDEIQRNPRMFTALKYLKEDAPKAFVAASGSLMGLALKVGFRAPVGCVDIAQLFPMTFYEFLEAAEEYDALAVLMQENWHNYPEYAAIFEKRLQQYLATGGMPKPVSVFFSTDNLDAVRYSQNQILSIFEQDFNVHTENSELTEKIRYTWHLACQLSGERNEKELFYQKMQGKRASEYYSALQWLEDCGLIRICRRALQPSGILAANIDRKRSNAFKVYPLDIGLRLAACRMPFDVCLDSVVKGKLLEQYVHQELYVQSECRAIARPAYYSWQYQGKSYEIDFLIPNGIETVPVEVKSKAKYEATSERQFQSQFHPKQILRITPRNPGCVPPIWSLPLSATQSAYEYLRGSWNTLVSEELAREE